MIETLIFAIVLLFVNLILIYRPVPILAFPVELVTLWVYATQFIESDIPIYFVFFLIIVNVSGLVVNALDVMKK